MDRELLELAAKAAGWTGWQSKHGYWNVKSPDGEETTHCHHWNAYCPDTGKKLKEPTFADAIADTNWNPLTDDGDALRLAVKLDMDIVYDFDRVMAVFGNKDDGCITEYFYDLPQPTDRYAATRRAIVRAAAEIGRSKNT